MRKYLYRHIGHLVTAGRPVFDQQRHCWRVPVLAKTDRGIFPVGEFELDERLNFIVAPTKDELTTKLRRQRERMLTLVLESPEEVVAHGLTPVGL